MTYAISTLRTEPKLPHHGSRKTRLTRENVRRNKVLGASPACEARRNKSQSYGWTACCGLIHQMPLKGLSEAMIGLLELSKCCEQILELNEFENCF